MNKNIFQLNRILPLSIGLFLFSLFLFPYNVRALSVPLTHDYQYGTMNLSNTNGDQGPDTGQIYALDYMSITLTKEFNLVTDRHLGQNDSVIAGTTIYSGASYTTGSYNFAGGFYGTPYLDGQTVWEYRRGSSTHEAFDKDAWIPFTGGIADYWDYYLTSSNPAAVSCSGKTCTASGNGTSTITVNWYNTSSNIYPYYVVIRGEATFQPVMYDCDQIIWVDAGGDGGGQWVTATGPFCTNDGGSDMVYSPERVGSSAFTPSPLYYTITSVIPDNPPTISNIQAQGVGYNDGMVSWSYSDADGDAQTWWNTQISTTDSFNPNDIVIWSGEPQTGSLAGAGAKTSNDTSTDFFPQNRGKLIPGTKYYTRVQVGNAKASSGWVDGPEFITQSYPQANINFNVIDSNGGETIAGDGIQFTWSITNPIGVQSCNASTTGGTDAGNGIWTGNKAALESPNTENAILALSQLDRTYNFTINCISKPGGNAIEPVTVSLNTKGREALVTLSSNISTDLKQGDFVNISRTIVNREVLTGCSNTVTGGPVAAGGNFISDTTTNDWISPPSREQIDPNIRSNATYIFTSTCSAIDGPSRSSSITVTVRPRPSISCNLQNKVVAENNNIIKLNLIGDPTWSGPYEWRVKRGIGTDLIYSNSALNNTVDLNYSDAINLGLGKYDIKAQLNAGGINSDEATCGSINSLGNRSIREVAK